MKMKMKMSCVFIGLALIAVTSTGCSVVGAKAANEVADVVAKYCENESAGARSIYRNGINHALESRGHCIVVSCVGDTTPMDQCHD